MTLVVIIFVIFSFSHLRVIPSLFELSKYPKGQGKRGAVASESATCSHHGTDMLMLGGNAADAVSKNKPSSSLSNN